MVKAIAKRQQERCRCVPDYGATLVQSAFAEIAGFEDHRQFGDTIVDKATTGDLRLISGLGAIRITEVQPVI